MADKDFVVKNGLVVNSTVLVANGTKVGVNTASPDAALTVAGSANIQGNVVLGGNTLTVSANTTFNGNVVVNSNTYFNERIYIGNNQNFVPLARPVMQAVDNFNGFVQLSSQNLANSTSGAENGGTDACSDMVVFGDDTDQGFDKFLDIGYNNSNFDGSYQYLATSNSATNLYVGSTLYQTNGSGNIAVGVLVSKASVNSTVWNVVISVANGGSFVPTSGANGSLRDIAGNSTTINDSTHRNYPFTISKKNDGYLYVANGALSIGTSEGGRRANVSDPMYDPSGNPLIFHTNGMLAENEAGRFVGNGNFVVGPNTTSRDAKLNVNGTANIAGQVNVGANLNVTGSINVAANLYVAVGVYSSSVNVGISSLSSTGMSVGANVSLDAATLKISGNSTVSSLNVASSNLTFGNASVVNAPLVRLINSTSSANLTSDGVAAGISSLNSTAIGVGSNVFVNASTMSMGNTSVNVSISASSANQLSLTGNAYVGGSMRIFGDLSVNGTTTFVGTQLSSGDFSPTASDVYNLGSASNTWSNVYASYVRMPSYGFASVGNSTANTVVSYNSVRSINTTSSANLTPAGLTVGTSVVNATGMSLGNSSVTTVQQVVVANTSGTTTINANYVSTTSLTGNLTGNVVATTISGNLTGNVAATIISGNLTGNVVAVTISGNLTGNVIATTISGNLTGNVSATKVSASANVTVGANVTINASAVALGNSTLASPVQVIVANSTATTTINANFISTTSISGNLTGNVVATSISGNLSGNVAATTLSGNLTGNVVATTISGNLTGNVAAVTVNATTINAATFQVGSSFLSNSSYLSVTGNSVLSGTNNSVTAELRVVNSTANMVLMTSNGNVGIANVSPAHKFRVDGTVSLAGAVSDVTSLAAGTLAVTSNVVVGNSTVNVTINSTSFTGTSNNTSYVGVTAAAAVVNTSQLSGNLASYQTTSGLSAAVAALTSNNTSYVGVTAAGAVVNSSQLSSNLANYQSTSGLSAAVAALTSNNTSYVGTTPAANVISDVQLSGNLANYQTVSGLTAAVASLAANSATYLNGQLASYYTNATNISTGTLATGRLPTVPLASGGTGANTLAGARTNLVIGNIANTTSSVGRSLTISNSSVTPTGGNDGDLWIQY